MSGDTELIGLLMELIQDVHQVDCDARMLKVWRDEPTSDEEHRHREQAIEDLREATDALRAKAKGLPDVFEDWIYSLSPPAAN